VPSFLVVLHFLHLLLRPLPLTHAPVWILGLVYVGGVGRGTGIG
jgi:hypothetical protein